MLTVLSLQVTLFSLVGLGFLVKRIGLVGEQGQKNLTDLVIYVVLPSNILVAFQNGTDGESLMPYLVILLIATGIQLISLVYGKIFYRRQPEGRRKCLQYATLCNNAGFIGNPIAEGIYGAEGLALASVYLIPTRIMMWSSGLAMFSGVNDRKAAIKRVILHPCIISCALGIILMVTGFKLPSIVFTPIQTVAKCNTALSMMVIGMILERIDLKHFWDKTVLVYSLHRLLIMPLLFWCICRLLPISETVFGVSVILTAMPAGATTSILAEKYGMESEFATKLVITSTLLSLPTVFLWNMILA